MALFYYYNIYIEILNLFLPQASLFLDQKYQCAAYSCIWVLHAKANKLHKYLLTVIVIFLAFWPFCFLAFCLFRLNKGHKRHALTCLMRLPLVLFFEGKDTKVDSKAMHLSKIFGLLTCLVFRTFWTWTVKNFSKFIRTKTFNRCRKYVESFEKTWKSQKILKLSTQNSLESQFFENPFDGQKDRKFVFFISQKSTGLRKSYRIHNSYPYSRGLRSLKVCR